MKTSFSMKQAIYLIFVVFSSSLLWSKFETIVNKAFLGISFIVVSSILFGVTVRLIPRKLAPLSYFLSVLILIPSYLISEEVLLSLIPLAVGFVGLLFFGIERRVKFTEILIYLFLGLLVSSISFCLLSLVHKTKLEFILILSAFILVLIEAIIPKLSLSPTESTDYSEINLSTIHTMRSFLLSRLVAFSLVGLGGLIIVLLRRLGLISDRYSFVAPMIIIILFACCSLIIIMKRHENLNLFLLEGILGAFMLYIPLIYQGSIFRIRFLMSYIGFCLLDFILVGFVSTNINRRVLSHNERISICPMFITILGILSMIADVLINR